MTHDLSINWRVVATSVCGTSHKQRSQPCQDAHYWNSPEPGILIAAVADGAGSAAFSEVGAQIAVKTVVEALRDLWVMPDTEGDRETWLSAAALTDDADTPPILTCLKDALETARQAVEAEAQAQQESVREFASTLILVVATPMWVAAAQVGDGAAVLGEGDSVRSLTSPSCGEYINETTFLVSPNALETAQFELWHGAISHFALLTDGLQLLALDMPSAEPHPPFFAPLFRFITQDELDAAEAQIQLENFLNSDRVSQRTDDDLTLLLAAKIG
jgi:Protein phosphatase 2C